MSKSGLKRAYSVRDILTYKPDVVDFDGAFERLIGKPELRGIWIIWGNSGNGKTSFALQLARYLTQFGKVAYNSLEEGLSLSIQKSIEQVGMVNAVGNFLLWDKEPLDNMLLRLNMRLPPRVVFVDSLQYCGMNKDQIKNLSDSYPNILFVFISHAAGKEPAGKTAIAVKYHANCKIKVEGFRAYCVSRYSESATSQPYTIWTQGADHYWMDKK